MFGSPHRLAAAGGSCAKAARLFGCRQSLEERIRICCNIDKAIHTIGIYKREYVEVVVVQEGLSNVVAGFVTLDELLRHILDGSCNHQHLLRTRFWQIAYGAVIHSRA
jgi:hypothetical protein